MALFNRSPMTGAEITAAVETAKTLKDFDRLTAQVSARRAAIAARLSEIGGSRHGHEGPARLAAFPKGPAAVQAIEKEAEQLDFERAYLDRLEMLLAHGRSEAEAAEAGRQIPAAVRRLASEAEAVRKALAALDAALASMNATVDLIGRFDSAGLPFPLTDDQLRELIAVREEAWRVRHVHILTPQRAQGQDEYWVARWPEVFDVSRLAVEGRWSLRAGPTPAPAVVPFDPRDRPQRIIETQWHDVSRG